MLRNDLYTVDSITESHPAFQVSVTLNPRHAIFKGHFPGHPVLPGVCMLEMIRELMEDRLKQKLRISKGPLIKFLAMIIPEKNTSFEVDLHYETKDGFIDASGRIFHGTTTFMKYNLQLIQEPV